MPFHHSHGEDTRAEGLPQIAGFPDTPALTEQFVPLEKVRELYRRVQESPAGFGLENLLAEMRVRLRVDAADTARIPVSGPVVVVANHPFGMLDGAALAVLLTRVRPDVKVMSNYLLRAVPELARHCLFLDPFQTNRAANTHSIDVNRPAVREALGWLQDGGMLVIFPAGEVSHWQFPQAQIADPAWDDTAARLIRRTGAAALPVYFCGRNSVSFHLFGMIHPRLRTAFLLQEFLHQEGRTVEVRVGTDIPGDSIADIANDREAMEYLRWRTYLLARRSRPEKSWSVAVRSKISEKVQEPVAPAEPAELLAAELSRLADARCLAGSGDLAVYLAKANETPRMLRELGRLRELTFRLAGEGTGKSRDLDRFDSYYWHVLLWHKGKGELAGAYRAGNTAEILAEWGVDGLYTSTLFRYQCAHVREDRSGARTGAFLRKAGIPAPVRSAAFVVERNRTFAGDPCRNSGVVWRGEHQQRLQQSLARDDLPLLRSARAGRRVGGADRTAAAVSSGGVAAVGLPRHVPRSARSGRTLAVDHRCGN
jgi:putative hemolysin